MWAQIAARAAGHFAWLAAGPRCAPANRRVGRMRMRTDHSDRLCHVSPWPAAGPAPYRCGLGAIGLAARAEVRTFGLGLHSTGPASGGRYGRYQRRAGSRAGFLSVVTSPGVCSRACQGTRSCAQRAPGSARHWACRVRAGSLCCARLSCRLPRAAACVASSPCRRAGHSASGGLHAQGGAVLNGAWHA